MKFLILAVFSLLLDVEVWSLVECWATDYADCMTMQKIEEIYDCAKRQEKKFERGKCPKKCGLATGTFTDKTTIELRYCTTEHDDCEDVKQLIKTHETKRKRLTNELQCSVCTTPLCNDPKYEAKSKNGVQNHKFPNIFILVTIFLIIFIAF